MTENTRPTIDERYASATNTSDLTLDVQVNSVQAAGMIMAAGWSREKLGVALLRLQSEWDGSERPRHIPRAAVAQLAQRILHGYMPRVLTEAEKVKRAHAMAAETANRWYIHELGLKFQRLKTLSEVRMLVAEFAWLEKIDSPHTKAAAAVSWWLDHTCLECRGRKWELIPGTNRPSNRLCEECEGLGEKPIPHGWAGRKLVGEIEEAVNGARGSIGSITR
ncbi:hypothetical protein ACQ858_08370 [Variovorax ureilyticus]|uniref:hypothetical protein n=1 Tax=Variovorax ureilyticus TaxID=1836198 RepID=UPI003D6742AC